MPNFYRPKDAFTKVLHNIGTLELDPLSFTIQMSLAIQTDYAFNFYYARQYDRAIKHLQKLKVLNPNFPRTYIFLSEIYETKEMYQESIEEFDRTGEFDGADARLAVRKTILENALRTAGAKGYWTKLRDNPQDITRGILGQVLAARDLGETDKAFEILRRLASLNKFRSLVWLKVSPDYDNLRSDPRFADLMRRVGIPQ